MTMTRGKLRQFWFSFHKWIGILLAVLIIPISVTGAVLVWHDALEEALHPARFAPTEAAALPPSAYVAAAQEHLESGDRIAQLRFGEKGQGAVEVSAVQPPKAGAGRPVRTMIWLNPVDANFIEKALSNSGVLQVMHVLHGSLLIPGWGRTIVGWLGIAMMISAISGLWLWWPTVGSWLRGLRWRRQGTFNANLHHMMGFWIAIPLLVLSLTGAWISFPAVMAPVNAVIDGSADQGQRGESRAGQKPQPDRAARMRARPLDHPVQTPDAALAAAQTLAKGAPSQMTWPTDLEPEWTVQIAPGGGKPLTVKVTDTSGVAKLGKVDGPQGGIARTMRRVHDGTDMGIIWRIIIFLGGILPAILSITGLIMWWRTRKWRNEQAHKRKAKKAASATA